MNSDATNPAPPNGTLSTPAVKTLPGTGDELDPDLELRLLSMCRQWPDGDRTA